MWCDAATRTNAHHHAHSQSPIVVYQYRSYGPVIFYQLQQLFMNDHNIKSIHYNSINIYDPFHQNSEQFDEYHLQLLTKCILNNNRTAIYIFEAIVY